MNPEKKATEETASFLAVTDKEVTAPGSADKKEDKAIIHKAKIITPQPYGIFALCKIYEYLQIN